MADLRARSFARAAPSVSKAIRGRKGGTMGRRESRCLSNAVGKRLGAYLEEETCGVGGRRSSFVRCRVEGLVPSDADDQSTASVSSSG